MNWEDKRDKGSLSLEVILSPRDQEEGNVSTGFTLLYTGRLHNVMLHWATFHQINENCKILQVMRFHQILTGKYLPAFYAGYHLCLSCLWCLWCLIQWQGFNANITYMDSFCYLIERLICTKAKNHGDYWTVFILGMLGIRNLCLRRVCREKHKNKDAETLGFT